MPSLPCPDRSPKCYLASRAPDEWNCYFQISAQTWFRSLLLYHWHVMLLNGPSQHDADGGIEESVDDCSEKYLQNINFMCYTDLSEERAVESFDDCSMRGKSASAVDMKNMRCNALIIFILNGFPCIRQACSAWWKSVECDPIKQFVKNQICEMENWLKFMDGEIFFQSLDPNFSTAMISSRLRCSTLNLKVKTWNLLSFGSVIMTLFAGVAGNGISIDEYQIEKSII